MLRSLTRVAIPSAKLLVPARRWGSSASFINRWDANGLSASALQPQNSAERRRLLADMHSDYAARADGELSLSSDETAAAAFVSAVRAMDLGDADTQMIADTFTSHLVDAVRVFGSQNPTLAAYGCRCLANIALVEKVSTEKGEVSGAQLLHQLGAAPLLVHLLATSFDSLLRVEGGRGAVWLLTAIQNLALRSDEAAYALADARVGGGLAGDSTATVEHAVAGAVAVMDRMAIRLAAECARTATADAQGVERISAGLTDVRMLVLALDAAAAVIARLLSLSVDQTTAASTTSAQHRADLLSSAVAHSLLSCVRLCSGAKFAPARTATDAPERLRSLAGALSPISSSLFREDMQELRSLCDQLDHKAWEALRLVSVVPGNLPLIIDGMHATDGQSGLNLLKHWCNDTLERLPARGGAPLQTLLTQEVALLQAGQGDILEMVAETRVSPLQQRVLCALDVLTELTHNAGSSGTGDEAFVSPAAALGASGICEFLTRVLALATEEAHAVNSTNTTGGPIASRVRAFHEDVALRALTVLTNLSEHDPYTRSQNCLAVLQRAFLSDDALCTSDSVRIKVCAFVWNVLNSADGGASIRELGLMDGVAAWKSADGLLDVVVRLQKKYDSTVLHPRFADDEFKRKLSIN